MPIMRLKEIRDMSSEERTKKTGELKTELVRLRTMTMAGGTVENPARMKELRRTIARLMTIEGESKSTPVKSKKLPEKPARKPRKARKEHESDS